MSEPVLKVTGLKKYYPIRRGAAGQVVKACDDVSFELYGGETLGIVGESGCGKTTTIQTVIRLIDATAGSVQLNGEDFLSLKGNELKKARQNGKIHDDYRIEYYRQHLEQIRLAIGDGCEMMGYCPWSAIDLISTHQGFKKRYGFVYINRDDQDLKDLARYKKDSFYWYKKVINTNGEDLTDNHVGQEE